MEQLCRYMAIATCSMVSPMVGLGQAELMYIHKEAVHGLNLAPRAADMKKWDRNTVELEPVLGSDSAALRLPEGRYQVIEGDLILPVPIAEVYSRERTEHMLLLDRKGSAAVMIMVPIHAGRKQLWPPGKTLRYSISAPTFASHGPLRDSVEQAIHKAAREWESLCNIRFEHAVEYDGRRLKEPIGDLDFVVAMLKDPGYPDAAYVAKLRKGEIRSTVYITEAFPGRVKPLMLMRHELGHVLGFLHEGNRAPMSTDCAVDHGGQALAVGAYCPHSVMHQICGEKVVFSYSFTSLDRCAAAQCYPFPDTASSTCEGAEVPCVSEDR